VVNAGAAAASGEYILHLNDDTEVLAPDFLEEMLSFAQLEGVGAVGAKLLFPNGNIQHAGVMVVGGNPGHPYWNRPGDYPGYFYSTLVQRNYSAVTAACLMVKKKIYQELGGMDPAFWMNYNDVDFCLRLRDAGYRLVYAPHAVLLHHESVSKAGMQESEIRMFKDKWSARIAYDPYYNPNFSTVTCDYSLGN
jgi:GT2 family glycosyltransferase